MLKYPNIDPVIFHIYGNLALRWYSLAYLIGFALSFFFLKMCNKKLKIVDNKLCEEYVSWCVVGLIIGARVFDCFVYNFYYTISHPSSIYKVWEGGLSFHGGAIGLILATFLFGKFYKVNSIRLFDICSVIIPIGLFFGRIANFINGELYGNITYTSPFRMIFPLDDLQEPRHPSQLYEAFFEGICLFVIMLILFTKTKMAEKTGLLVGSCGFFYSIFRFICEFFRKPEVENVLFLTAGQILSIIMLIASIIWIWYFSKKHIVK